MTTVSKTTSRASVVCAALATIAMVCGGCEFECPPRDDYYGFELTFVDADSGEPICDAQVSYIETNTDEVREAEVRDCTYYGSHNRLSGYEVEIYHPQYELKKVYLESRFGMGGREPESEGCGILGGRAEYELEPFSI